ncbi:MAG: hypothetical protein FWG19_00975, partial [Methanomassiliicoccaceae archaeon]|nr:hypothetical protein [Methanomassiliicoccaceae archaeon]
MNKNDTRKTNGRDKRSGIAVASIAIALMFVLSMPLIFTDNSDPDDAALGAFSTEPMVAAGGAHSLALKSDGTVWTWGYNSDGQLGDGTRTDRTKPVQVKGPGGSGYLTGVTAIAAGSNHSMALKEDGTVWAWGYDLYGQLGDGDSGTEANKSTPVQVKDQNGTGYLTDVKAIAAGELHSMALKDDGTLWTWGFNFQGQLGDGTSGLSANKSTPALVLSDVRAIAASGTRSVALKNDGMVYAWGDYTVTPTQVSGLSDVTAIATGERYSIALKNDGTVWAWGNNFYSQLGNGTTNNSNTPVQVKEESDFGFLTNVKIIAAGPQHSMALKNDGTVWAWGYNINGQLGDGTSGPSANKSTPVPVLTDVKAIATGGGLTGYNITNNNGHSIAVKNDGTVWAWGANEKGNLGDGTSGSGHDKNVPVYVF